MEFNLGNRLAQIVADLIYANGGCGPFGGERPIVNDNVLSLYSQSGREKYKFNNDGTVSLILNKQLKEDLGLSYEADLKCYENIDVIDLIEGRTDLSWFMNLDKGKTKVVRFLKMLFGK